MPPSQMNQLLPRYLYVIFSDVQTFLSWPSKTYATTKKHRISLLQSKLEKKKNTLLLHYISIPPNWW